MMQKHETTAALPIRASAVTTAGTLVTSRLRKFLMTTMRMQMTPLRLRYTHSGTRRPKPPSTTKARR